ncbi:MAG: glycosyltransferase family 2 protein [Candidatus Freyarchaeota archaeon]|nr:glycosyltransferase family 2 protein [Candidatus Jordarchaeia archaeon]MBS7270062.1 glycosyltransferase family 2 protein [Candidatus Jordarchaeia archaeon]MBS7278342.1 glycosyltransferase family 2 protein [Candidatus Jordarchaeia archaeon]
MEKLDVVVCTYQSGKYLDECLTSIKQYVPVNNLIVVDHYSTDDTLKIAGKHGAQILLENVSLGHARQIGMNTVSTRLFLFVDSDAVLSGNEWLNRACEMLNRDDRLGAVVLDVPTRTRRLEPKVKYDNWWRKFTSQSKNVGFFCIVTLLKKEALKRIRIPSNLSSGEDKYIGLYLNKNGWKYYVMKTEESVHYCDHGSMKSLWEGAGDRKLFGLRLLPSILIRKILLAPVKALLPAIFERDVKIITWNTIHWLDYLKGFLKAEKYWNMKRS